MGAHVEAFKAKPVNMPIAAPITPPGASRMEAQQMVTAAAPVPPWSRRGRSRPPAELPFSQEKSETSGCVQIRELNEVSAATEALTVPRPVPVKGLDLKVPSLLPLGSVPPAPL